jgi:hypothetical protein
VRDRPDPRFSTDQKEGGGSPCRYRVLLLMGDVRLVGENISFFFFFDFGCNIDLCFIVFPPLHDIQTIAEMLTQCYFSRPSSLAPLPFSTPRRSPGQSIPRRLGGTKERSPTPRLSLRTRKRRRSCIARLLVRLGLAVVYTCTRIFALCYGTHEQNSSKTILVCVGMRFCYQVIFEVKTIGDLTQSQKASTYG